MPIQDVGAYTYSSQPHSAPSNQLRNAKLYKSLEQPSDGTPLTLMSDPRVIRGNTHSLARKITKVKIDMSSTKITSVDDVTTFIPRPSYSYQVKSFSNNEIDVSKYLVEQNICAVKVKNVDNQTDEFSGRPQSAEYIPRKTGVDRSTQVDDVRELFDFDAEVAPILEIIVHKTLEQSLFELSAEHELLSLELAAADFHAENDRESEWMRGKEVEVIKENIATKVRIQALELRKQNETATKSLIAGLQMMHQIFSSIVEDCISVNFSSGIWQEPERVLVSNEILPLLLQDVVNRHDAYCTAQIVLDSLLENAQIQYLTFPHQRISSLPRIVKLNVTFKRSIPIDDVFIVASEDIQETTNEVQPTPVMATTLEFSIGPQDTAMSMERAVLTEISRLKASIIAESNDSIGFTPTESAVIVSQFLSSGSPMNIKSKLTTLMSQYCGPPLRIIASDATLVNFPLPESIHVEFVFNL